MIPVSVAPGDTTPRTGTPELLSSDARQFIFRACLDLLARPGTVRRILPGTGARWTTSGYAAAAAPLLALADLMTPLAVLSPRTPDDVGQLARIAGLTLAPRTPPGEARLVLSLGAPGPAELGLLHRGTDLAPHHGALVCQAVSSVGRGNAEGEGLRLRLTGPGIKGARSVSVAGLPREFFEARRGLVEAFPRGVDMLLVSPDGQALGLPRTTRIEVAAP